MPLSWVKENGLQYFWISEVRSSVSKNLSAFSFPLLFCKVSFVADSRHLQPSFYDNLKILRAHWYTTPWRISIPPVSRIASVIWWSIRHFLVPTRRGWYFWNTNRPDILSSRSISLNSFSSSQLHEDDPCSLWRKLKSFAYIVNSFVTLNLFSLPCMMSTTVQKKGSIWSKASRSDASITPERLSFVKTPVVYDPILFFEKSNHPSPL